MKKKRSIKPVHKKVIAVDFDGTLVFNHYPFIENPNYELLDFIKQHRRDYTWILWTCREDKQLQYATDWLRDEHGIEFDYVNENVSWQIEEYGNSRKVWADIYLDDKNADWKEFINN